ncbi:PfkB family carbohydrate kinase, partial [Bradyrhizobium japonicum]|uniref:PfkB family carbohydrate kinase n=1 Tax=Bradyrhizobium japonicum TaxID=375 RepID=UPI001FCE0627
LYPGFQVNAVDTTGAGDAFNGGFAHALAEGKTILQAIRYANAVAALSVTKVGTAPAMPAREEVAQLLQKS